ncbi:hypothetical protein VNO80_23334 [Phaseolus coccineus]|uniref:Uncharacterized protein n=1 Tax=Phaseolus coccineus TaxID=3886 RepID=A0AAN9QV38_PHACN
MPPPTPRRKPATHLHRTPPALGGKKIMQPLYIEHPNNDGIIPRDLFTKKRAELLKKGESWMKRTTTSSMVVSTLIATGLVTLFVSIISMMFSIIAWGDFHQHWVAHEFPFL